MGVIRIMEEVEFEIDWEGKKEKVIIKSLSFGEGNDAVRNSITENVDGSRTFDFVGQQEHKLLKSIKKAPFPLTIEALKNLPDTIGNQIFNEFMKLNSIGTVLSKNLGTPSNTGEPSAEETQEK